MIPSGNKKLFFLSCVTTSEEIKKLKNDEKVASIYHVCGVDPWLIVCAFDSQNDAISLKCDYQLNIKYMSIASTPTIREKESAQAINKIIFWIFIQGTCKKEFESFINEIEDIYEAYEIFGEYNFIVKLYTSNINGVDDFLKLCREKGMSTSTKCVLSTIKENGRDIDNVKAKEDKAIKIKKDINYAAARIMFNTKGFIQKSKDEQKRILSDNLGRLGIPFTPKNIEDNILDPVITKSEYFQDELIHPNNLIDRYSVKLNRNKWLKTLLFFKASHGEKDKLEEALQERFLGVKPLRFARKLYHTTGDYDFFIPFDCSDLDELTESIKDFWKWQEKEKEELIISFTNTVCEATEGKGEVALEELNIPFIESLLINATQMSEFEDRIRAKNIFLPILEGKWVPAEEGISPREDYVRNKLRDEKREAIEDCIKKFKSFEDIGLESTIEFKDGALIQALSKFYFKNINSRERFLGELKDKIEHYEIVSISYEPVRDPLTVMCILMVKDLVELEVFFEELRRFCKKIEFHIIFHQTYYSKVIEQNIRCKPCFYPLEPKKDCIKECDVDKWQNCEGSKKCVIQKCGNCIRYILHRQRNRILNINFKKNIKQKIKISLIGIDISLSQYFALEKLLDQEGYRNKIFENYKKYENVCREKGEENPYGNSESIFSEYEDIIVKRDDYRNRYKDAINSIFKGILYSDSPDIIVFPEYTIPSYAYNEIIKNDIEKNCIIIAGSYINDGFNICPIIFNEDSKKKVYHYYKNNFSDFEKDLGLIYNKGTAYLKFLNTIMGNLFIQVCYDAFTINTSEVFNNVDILLIPSFNPSSKFIDPLKNKANEYKLIVAYANTINNKAAIKSNFFVPPNNGLHHSLRGIKPFHKDQRPEGQKLTNENIFNLSEDEQKIEDFNFTVKHLVFDIIQLDMRR